MKRETKQADHDWAASKLLLLWELVARRLAADGQPELARRVRAIR